MCGIFGAVSGSGCVVGLVLTGLSRLEYRGYDSCGIAILDSDLKIESRKSSNKVVDLQNIITREVSFNSQIGIAHTRWATHGVPNIVNAHPLHNEKVAIVHNGIIENYSELRGYLENLKFVFDTDTDTEVIPNLITMYLNLGFSPEYSVTKALERLEGSFAIVALFSGYSDMLIAATKGMSLAIGKKGDGTHVIASDIQSLTPFSREIITLEDHDIAKITPKLIQISNHGIRVNRSIKLYDICEKDLSSKNYEYFTLKEIYEQPDTINQTLNKYLDNIGNISLPALQNIDFCNVDSITIVGCGSSYFAGLIAKSWLEKIAKIRIYLEISSEFRYNQVELKAGDIIIFISQSGETVDTIEALRYAKQYDQITISIINVPDSTMEKLSDIVLKTFSGIEVGVASTKTFSSQLVVFACFTLWLAKIRQKSIIYNNSFPDNSFPDNSQLYSFLQRIKLVPQHLRDFFREFDSNTLNDIVDILSHSNKAMIIGRGISYGVALEGALKIKELSYVNTLGIAAGEMKHGSIALVDKNMPVIVVMPYDDLFFKNLSNVQEIVARNGIVIVFTDHQGLPFVNNLGVKVFLLPETDIFISAIFYTIPMQLIAYFISLKKGINVDQPRNLAKSVTVE